MHEKYVDDASSSPWKPSYAMGIFTRAVVHKRLRISSRDA
jgi:hypothetical protein